ncbi:hypothetical protein FHT93_001221 [Rhizobium sp. BK379]|nr:hypothetical protein [Rhizobium sp. BK379]
MSRLGIASNALIPALSSVMTLILLLCVIPILGVSGPSFAAFRENGTCVKGGSTLRANDGRHP